MWDANPAGTSLINGSLWDAPKTQEASRDELYGVLCTD